MALLHEVTLTWPHSEPQGVIVTGTFDNWSSSVHCSRTAGGFSAKVKVPWGEKVLYKFIVDGNWNAIPTESTETDWRGNINNVYQAPPAPITPPTPPPEPVSLPAPVPATVPTEPVPIAVAASSQTDALAVEETASPEPVVPSVSVPVVSESTPPVLQETSKEDPIESEVSAAPNPIPESTKAAELPATSTETASLGLAYSPSTRAADESEKSDPATATTEHPKEHIAVPELEAKPTPVADSKPAEEIKPTPAESKLSPSEDIKSPPVDAAVPSTPIESKVEVPKPIETSPADRHTTPPATPKADEASTVVPKTPTKEQSAAFPASSPGSPISRKESEKDATRKKRGSIFGKIKRAFSHSDKEKK